jgi:hypothetical protein
MATAAVLLTGPSVVMAAAVEEGDEESSVSTIAATTTTEKEDRLKLSNEELLQIIRDDIVQRQFLVTGNITKSIYAPYATFTDEIDTYKMDQWMIGTQRLFVGDRSQVRLVHPKKSTEKDTSQDFNKDDIIFTSPTTIEFAFDEDLMFNLPFIKPVVSLTGKVVLTRDPTTGYIISYREYWDQDVATVLKSAKF